MHVCIYVFMCVSEFVCIHVICECLRVFLSTGVEATSARSVCNRLTDWKKLKCYSFRALITILKLHSKNNLATTTKNYIVVDVYQMHVSHFTRVK